MPDTEIVKLRVRRGEDSQRRKIILEQGELGYTTDTKRLWVGDGILSGGNVTGNKWRGFVNGTPAGILNSETGDLVFNTANKILYAWNSTEWTPITFESEGSTNSVVKSHSITAGTYTAGTNSETVIYCDCTIGNITVYLPKVAASVDRQFQIKKTDTTSNKVIIDGDGIETIDKLATYELVATTRPSIIVHSDGTEWWKH